MSIGTLSRFGVLILFAGCFGCGSGIYPVRGKVTFEGKPLPGGGAISFVPVGNQRGKAAGGDIAPDGTYRLMTNRAGDGSMTGEFRVVIMQSTAHEPNSTPDGVAAPEIQATVAPQDIIPEIYSDHQKSPLTAKVEAKSNEINFDLKRQ